MHLISSTVPDGWLAFEVTVLRKLDFRSAAIPFTGEPHLGLYLKRLGRRVVTNDLSQWAYTKAKALIENNGERLTEEDVDSILELAYVPRETCFNPALLKWFNETDAIWFDNVRDNIEKIASPIVRAQALTVGMMVGDYVLSFDEETRELRQPLALSNLFRRFLQMMPPPVNNSQRNACFSREARDFTAEQHTDLMFLRLPHARNRTQKRMGLSRWREEWVRGSDDFWTDLEHKRSGRLGDYVETRQQYLRLVEDFLLASSHIETWAIAYVEDGFVSSNELTECVGRVRKIEGVYTKDFSELTGARATIITA
jgi:adenine-specific DNA methylase